MSLRTHAVGESQSGTLLLHHLGLAACVVALSLLGGAAMAVESSAKPSTDQLQEPTHRQVRVIHPEVDGKKVSRLYTIATTPEGRLVAGVTAGGSKYVVAMDSEGKTLDQWSLELTPSGLAVAPDGTIYAAGDGRIARLGPKGTVAKVIDSPHLGNVEEMKKKAAESLRASRKAMAAAYERQIESLKGRLAKIEEIDEDDRSRLQQAQLKAFKSQLEMLERMTKVDGGAPQINSVMARSMQVTSLAASDKDLFICAYAPGGSGYSVWRVGRDLEGDASEVVMEGLRGCCGQMDIQCCKGQLVVSENTNFKIGIYDRNGRAQSKFGSRDRTSRAGFGSCCNPMNSLPLDDGTILTAESSIGHIKKFDTDGKLVAYIGKASIGGGCKHCALGHDAENDLYYMMHQDANSICVLANNADTPLTVAEKNLKQRQTDFLARAAGLWKMETGEKDPKSDAGGLITLFGGGRGGSSQHPVTALQLHANGDAKIMEGMYKAYGDKAQLELLPKEDDKDTFAFALAIDQVRFLEGEWKFAKDDQATVSFQGMASVTMKRDAAGEPSCPESEKPMANQAVAVNDLLLDLGTADSVDEDQPGVFIELDSLSIAPTLRAQVTPQQASPVGGGVKFEYKLLSKADLGDDPVAALNQLGAEGWEHSGKLGKQLMFKRRQPSASLAPVTVAAGGTER